MEASTLKISEQGGKKKGLGCGICLLAEFVEGKAGNMGRHPGEKERAR